MKLLLLGGMLLFSLPLFSQPNTVKMENIITQQVQILLQGLMKETGQNARQ